MLTRENEGSKKAVRKVVQDFVHQYAVEKPCIFRMFLHAFPTTTSLQTHLTLSDIQFRSQTETPPAKAIGAV